MTEREKIIEIIESNKLCVLDMDCNDCPYKDKLNKTYSCGSYKLADTLIKAGVGDVKRQKKEAEYWENEAKTARADIDDAVKEITTRIFRELRNWFADQSAYAVDCNQHLGYYDYEIKASDVVCDIVEIAEKYGVELGAKDDD